MTLYAVSTGIIKVSITDDEMSDDQDDYMMMEPDLDE